MKNDLNLKIDRMLSTITNESHREEIDEYVLVRSRIDKVKLTTLFSNVMALTALSRFLEDKPFVKATQDDLLKFEEFLETEHKSASRNAKPGVKKSTVMNYEASIKRFYKFLSDKTTYRKGKRFQRSIPYPNSVSWMTVSENTTQQYPLDKIMTEEDLLKLLNATHNDRDKAIIAAALYDAGLRLGEMCSLNIENVGFDKLGGYFILPKDGEGMKTGMRKVRLFLVPSSTKYLKQFLNNHPFKQYSSAPLFITYHHRKLAEVNRILHKRDPKPDDLEIVRMTHGGFESKFRTIVTAAGFPELSAHDLRHNSATQCAKAGFNEMELRIRYGWSATSKMPSKYVHLASKDLDEKIKVITGFEEPDEPEKGKLIPIVCWNCNEENVPTNRFCSLCGLDLQRLKEDMIPAKEIGLTVQELMNDKEFMLQMMEAMAKRLNEKQNLAQDS